MGEKCDGKCWGFWRKAEVFGNNINADGKAEGESCNEKHSSSVKNMRGRRAKQKHEAELEFLSKPINDVVKCN